MRKHIVKNYNDFTDVLLKTGFSIGGGNNEGIFSIISWSWNDETPYETPVRWHTGEMETDPWEWRMRVLDERNDMAYGKIFFKKSGYVTKEWAPYFLAVRREGKTFEEDYADGKISNEAKRIYEVVSENQTLPVHGIKALAGFGKEDKSKFDRGLTELQMKMYITMCGRQQKISQKGEEYGWSSTMFCTTEHFWGEEIFETAAELEKAEAVQKIREQVYRLNPEAVEKKVLKFING